MSTTTMKAIRVHTPGPEENMILEDVAIPTPKPGEALVKLEASGVNFIDIYFRTGLYPAPEKPFLIGMEGAGVVTALGEGVTGLNIGDRVAFASQRGSYAQYISVPAWMLVPVPAGLDLEMAACLMLQGMTVHYLTHSTFPLAAGHTCLVHAASGGVGLLLVQVAKMLGATVIGTVSTDAKEQLAREAGADHVLRYDGFSARVKELTGGKGVDVVYDSVGKDTFDGSLDSLKPRGMMVTFGNASGPVPPVAPLALTQRGSLFLTRPKLADYTLTREELLLRAGDVMRWKLDHRIQVHISQRYSLADSPRAHQDLAGRKTSGKLIISTT